MVDRLKSTGIASMAPAGAVVIVVHISRVVSLSKTIAVVGIEKVAAIVNLPEV